MKLYALSDIHLNYEVNRQALAALPPHPDDWLILAGDIGESLEHLIFALRLLVPRFRQVVWVPGNHDLWTLPNDSSGLRGENRYLTMVAICRSFGVLTPEDPYHIWPGEGAPCAIAPLFLLYDYTFRPDDVPAEGAIQWAMDEGVLATDESFLYPDPYATRIEWCRHRCEITAYRLSQVPNHLSLVLINHFALRRDVVHLPLCPRFSLWCGTRTTEDWHRRFRAKVVVSGHLHVRATDWRDGVRFEEVSLGYPPQWKQQRGAESYLREILPGPAVPNGGVAERVYHR